MNSKSATKRTEIIKWVFLKRNQSITTVEFKEKCTQLSMSNTFYLSLENVGVLSKGDRGILNVDKSVFDKLTIEKIVNLTFKSDKEYRKRLKSKKASGVQKLSVNPIGPDMLINISSKLDKIIQFLNL